MNPALTLQTSGSTGEPLFHQTSHADLNAILERDMRAMEISFKDRLLTFCPLNHGLGLYAVLGALSVGGGVILPHEFSRGSLISGLMERPTWMVAVPPVIQAIYQARTDERLRPLFAGVRFVRVGGAPFDPALGVAFEDAYGVPVLDGYGMTECPCVARNTLKERRTGSVGKPAPGINVRIGAVNGNVWVRLATGHWHDTGDKGHFDADGFLYIDQAHKTTVRKTWKEREVQC